MTSSAEAFAADTSVVIASIDSTNPFHDAAFRAVSRHRPALAGHAAFEAYSVLTRQPGASRLLPAQAVGMLDNNFPDRCWLGARSEARLLTRLGELGIAGGAVYDALVGQAAIDNHRILLTLDRRALATYAALGVNFRLVDTPLPFPR